MKLITGRAGSGKTMACLEEIKRSVEEAFSKPLIYIVPEQFSFEAEKRLIETIGKNGIIGLQVLSFKRLAHRVFEEENFQKEYIQSAGKAMLIYSIMLDQDKKLSVLKNVAKNIGLVDVVMEMIDEFKRYNITPQMIKNINVKNEYLKMKLEDLYILYDEFEEKIKDKYIDVSDELTVLANLVSGNEYLNGAKIWIDEFDGFTPQEMNIIEKLNILADVTVTITTDNNENELFLLNDKNVKKIEKICKTVEKISLDKIYRFESSELEHLEKNIFKYPYKIYTEGTRDISILYSNNQYSEIEDIAGKIVKLVKEGMRYDNIAILTRDIEFYQNIIEKVFIQYDIPFFLDNKKQLYSEPLILLITSLLDICSNNYSYESIFSYLRTGLTNIQDMNDIDIVENYVLKYGIRGNTWLKEWELEDKQLEKINIIRERIISPISNFKNRLDNKKTVEDIITALYDYLSENGIYENMQKCIETLKNNNEIKIANEYSQVWNQLMSIFDEMYDAVGKEKISFENFKNTFRVGISEHTISTIPPTNDQIIIGDVTRTKNSNIKVLFVIGLNDGIFPKAFSSEGFINDRERNDMLEAGIEVAKDTKMLLLEENFNIYKSFTAPSNKIYLYVPVANLEGTGLRPSPIISQIKRIFPKIKETNEASNKEIEEKDLITTKSATIIPLLRNMRNFADKKEINLLWGNVYKWYKDNYGNFESIEKAIDYKNTIENISKTNAEKLYGTVMNSSVSKLEKYENCPFSFYLKYGLNAKEREIYKLTIPDIGSFLHEVIEQFSKYVIENNIDLNILGKEKCDEIIEDIVATETQKYKNNLFGSTERMKRLGNKLSRIVKRMMWIIIFHIKSGEFRIAGSEIEFGDGKRYPAIEIKLSEGGKLKLKGKIDRIDVFNTGEGDFVRIIDYKSSEKHLKLSNVYYGIQLQLLSYMYAISTEYKMAGAFYLKLDNPMIKSNKDKSNEEIENEIIKSLRMNGLIISDENIIRSMDKNMTKESDVLNLSIKKDGTYSKMPVATVEQFNDLMEHMKRTLNNIGNEIMSGNVKNEPIKNKNHTPCEYCEYYTACQFNRELGNKYRYINDLRDEVIFDKIKKT